MLRYNARPCAGRFAFGYRGTGASVRETGPSLRYTAFLVLGVILGRVEGLRGLRRFQAL